MPTCLRCIILTISYNQISSSWLLLLSVVKKNKGLWIISVIQYCDKNIDQQLVVLIKQVYQWLLSNIGCRKVICYQLEFGK